MSGLTKTAKRIEPLAEASLVAAGLPNKKSTVGTTDGSTAVSDSTAVSEVWHTKAACRGPHQTVFYPPAQLERRPDRRRREARAKEICADCPVQSECLRHAFQIREQHGIWGGLTEKERRLLMAQGAG